MKNKFSIAVIFTLIFAVVSIILGVNQNESSKNNTSVPTITENTATEDEAEMRGLWVSYISLDMSGTDYSEKAFRAKFEDIADTAENYGVNALFVHVRAFCDAFYESEIFPSSHIISARQGNALNFDALEIMTEICKEKGLEIHAWINPYRVTSDINAFDLAKNNPYVLKSSIGVEYENYIYLNPANIDARKLIISGIEEIIKNYEVDGIHFDDYFYPTANDDFDKADYNTYLKAFASEEDAMALSEWRKNNVNMLIAEVYRTIKEYNPEIKFGISPQGNIDNCNNMGADVKSWCESIGYVDYICPQLYFSLENPALSFEAGLESWLKFDKRDKVKIYAGLALYKAGTESDEGTWKKYDDILKKELEIIRDNNLDGFILYDYEALKSETAQAELKNFYNAL